MTLPDKNYKSLANVSNVSLTGVYVVPENAGEWDDSFKLSNCQNIEITGLYVIGGRENAVDINNHCAYIKIEDAELSGGDQCSIVVKGSSDHVLLKNVLLSPSPNAWGDILIDDWSKQGKGAAANLRLIDVRRKDGKPVRVVFGRWKKPIVGPMTNVEVQWLPTLGLHLYNIAKDVGVFLRLWKP